MPAPSILIVEDEGIAAVNLEQKITELGYKSAGIAFNAEEAFELVRSKRPDLILLDIQLRNGPDGIQFADSLREEMDVPVVFVTAFSDDLTIQRAKQTLPFGYLIKPLREEAIRSTVEMALQKHRSERELKNNERQFRTELITYLGQELQSPLSSMIGYADLLNGITVGEKERRIFLQRIRSSGELLSSFLNEILEFSKSDFGGIAIEKKKFCFDDLVAEVVSVLSTEAESKKLEFKVVRDPGTPNYIVSDERHLKQVLINVIGNAIKFTDRGRVQVSISTRLTNVVVQVMDTGDAIDAEQERFLFDPFHSIHSPAGIKNRRVHRGVGLGLSLSKKLASALGGDLSLVQTVAGEGVTFELVVPFM